MLKTCSQNYLKEILNKRIGHGAADALDIMDHPFFENIDWDMLLRKEILPPYIPKTKKIDDLRHIDPMFKNEIVKDTPNERELDLQEKENNHFKEFTYCKEVNTVYISENDLSRVYEEDDDIEYQANSELND